MPSSGQSCPSELAGAIKCTLLDALVTSWPAACTSWHVEMGMQSMMTTTPVAVVQVGSRTLVASTYWRVIATR
jgi:hypothetical protein